MVYSRKRKNGSDVEARLRALKDLAAGKLRPLLPSV